MLPVGKHAEKMGGLENASDDNGPTAMKGLRKIIEQYPYDTAPLFRSTEQSFVVTLNF